MKENDYHYHLLVMEMIEYLVCYLYERSLEEALFLKLFLAFRLKIRKYYDFFLFYLVMYLMGDKLIS